MSWNVFVHREVTPFGLTDFFQVLIEAPCGSAYAALGQVRKLLNSRVEPIRDHPVKRAVRDRVRDLYGLMLNGFSCPRLLING